MPPEDKQATDIIEASANTTTASLIDAPSSKNSQFERIPTKIFGSSKVASTSVAREIANLIKLKEQTSEPCVLGLATGSTPQTVYQELIRMHREEGLSFRNVVTFNLDEYYPMQQDSLHSYNRFMKEHLFDHVDILPENVHVPDGSIAYTDVHTYCADYEKKIEQAGGLDIQILGIGRTGHIGFNEPGSTLTSSVRLITLDRVTRVDAASDFFHIDSVPRKALTMGIGTIMKAKCILLMAWGESKSNIIRRSVEGPVSDDIPATFLQHHPNATFVLDEASSAELTQVKTPWRISGRVVDWNPDSIKKALIWLSCHLGKPLLKLTEHDYMEYGLCDIYTKHRSLDVFNELQKVITNFPGGGSEIGAQPERPMPLTKRVLIFSPHPDDDVISMGGTFARLVEQGHEVYVAYQTSGSIAVHDDDAVRFADFYSQLSKSENIGGSKLYDDVKHACLNKKPGDVDPPLVLGIKSLIRKTEARAAARFVGVPDSRMHFLEMPFYETGKVKKKPLGDEDLRIVSDLIRSVKPHQIFAAGDLSDPHGTHRVCLSAILQSCKNLKEEEFMKDCWLWLYRGAWQEYPIDEMDMAVPLNQEELTKKREAIFKHESQKDSALFPGNDPREFWQRAEARNRNTARLFDDLGLPEYEAMEAFKRYFY